LYIQNGEWVIISAFSTAFKSRFNFGNSLRVKIFIITMLTGIIPVLLVSEIFKQVNKSDLIENRIGNIKTQSQILATQLSSKTFSAGDMPESIDEGIMQLSNTLDGRIILVDTNLKIVRDSYNLDDGRTILAPQIVACLKNKESGMAQTDEGYVLLASPILDAGQKNVKGVLVVLASEQTELLRAGQVSGRILIVELVSSLIIIILAFVFAKFLVKPFYQLSESITDMSEGYTGETINFSGYKEMQQLSDAVNTMVGKMQTLDNSRQEFVSNVSHELKTPITSMKVLADSLLVQEDVPVELYKEFMLDIADEIERENKIINDLLALVKMDKSSSDVNIAPVTINEVIELILKRIRPIAAKNNIELVFESFRPVTAEVDEVKLTLAFSNLIENAVKYNVENGWVHVSLNADHKFFYVKVADSGIGIPEESLENIYERFYRVDKSHSREIGGTGLGLAITRSAILKHRGSIKVYSKEGEGTTFTVRIPLTYVF